MKIIIQIRVINLINKKIIRRLPLLKKQKKISKKMSKIKMIVSIMISKMLLTIILIISMTKLNSVVFWHKVL